MESIYFLALGLLFVFAIFDLVVGISNDAVNFLNSAFGSKAASRKKIMLIASLGIFLGAILSSGMMEVARKGVFNPSAFYFPDLLFIFLAVMIADIILLDLFSTIGLPTSTTISIVFCLLGASFSISLLKINFSSDSLIPQSLSDYINAKGLLKIVSGIFLSIFVSFLSGAFIHYFIRYFFSFDYEKKIKKIGFIWVSIALSSMTYFLLVKGLQSTIKGLNPEQLNGFLEKIKEILDFVNQHSYVFLGSLFLISVFLTKLFIHLGYNLLKFTVLYGTFSLAMAFAGNDLVNFIGVPIAGFQAYELWHLAGEVESFFMKGLSRNIQTSPFVLLIAGFIMVLTLWFSKKAHNLSDTEISLGRQDEGNERFKASEVARFLVRFFRKLSDFILSIFPKKWIQKIEKNFSQNPSNEQLDFDLIRASSNLTISSILIALATSYKLPLSTTFVTFMVAMGTSLSDRAWGRESAVYRIAGVLRVISGWFLTAGIAFCLAAIAASLLWFFKIWGLLILVGFMGWMLYKNHKKHQKISQQKEIEKTANLEIDELNLVKTLDKTSELLIYISKHLKEIYTKSIDGLAKEELKGLQECKKEYTLLREFFTAANNTLIKTLGKTQVNEIAAGTLYLKIYNQTKHILEDIGSITYGILEHVKNSHKPLKPKQKRNFDKLKFQISTYLELLLTILEKKEETQEIKLLSKMKKATLKQIEYQLDFQIKGIVAKKYGAKNSTLAFEILLKSKDLIKELDAFFKLYFHYKNLSIKFSNDLLINSIENNPL